MRSEKEIKEMLSVCPGLTNTIHAINFDKVIEEWDLQTQNNLSFYNADMQASAHNIENLLMQLRDEYKNFMDAGKNNQNPKALAVKELMKKVEKMLEDMGEELD